MTNADGANVSVLCRNQQGRHSLELTSYPPCTLRPSPLPTPPVGVGIVACTHLEMFHHLLRIMLFLLGSISVVVFWNCTFLVSSHSHLAISSKEEIHCRHWLKVLNRNGIEENSENWNNCHNLRSMMLTMYAWNYLVLWTYTINLKCSVSMSFLPAPSLLFVT